MKSHMKRVVAWSLREVPEASTLAILVMLGLVALAFAFNWGGKELWLDESYSVHLALQSPQEVVVELRNDNGPPLYYLGLMAWIRLFGASEFAVTALSGALFVLTLGFVWLASRDLFDQPTANLACLLFLLSRVAIVQAHNARMYSLLSFLAVLSIWSFLQISQLTSKQRSSVGFALLFVVANVAGTFTHYWFLFLVGAEVVTALALTARKVLVVVLATASLVPFTAIWSPILAAQLGNGSTEHTARPDLLWTIPRTLVDFYGGLPVFCAVVLPPIFVYLMLRLFFIQAESRDGLLRAFWDNRVQALLLLLLVSLATPLFVSQLKPMYVVGRYTIIGLFPFVVVLARAITLAVPPRVVLIYGSVLLVGAVGAWAASNAEPVENRKMEIGAYVADQSSAGDFLVYTGVTRASMEYYLGLQGASEGLQRLSFPVENGEHLGWSNMGRLIDKKDVLALEAEVTAEDIERRLAPGTKVWLFFGEDMGGGGVGRSTEIAELMRSALDSRLRVVDRRNGDRDLLEGLVVYESLP